MFEIDTYEIPAIDMASDAPTACSVPLVLPAPIAEQATEPTTPEAAYEPFVPLFTTADVQFARVAFLVVFVVMCLVMAGIWYLLAHQSFIF